MIYAIYLLVGVFAGLLSGLFGVGGGIIVVPALVFLFQYSHSFSDGALMHIAAGTSLAIMIFTASSSAYAYYRRNLINWSLFINFTPGLMIGLLAGSLIAKNLSSNFLIILFAIFLILIALHLFFSKPESEVSNKEPPPSKSSFFLLTLAAISIGLLSTIFGIGGGLLMVPFFIYSGLKMRQSSGTASLCGVPIAVIGTIALTISGWSVAADFQVPDGTVGYVYWPAVGMIAITSIIFAPVGTKLALWFEQKTLKKIFAIVLMLSAINLLLVT